MMQIKKNNILFLSATTLFILSCSGQKYVPLNNSRFATKVPNKSSLYKNIEKFDVQILDYIDTNAVYEQYCVQNLTLCRLDNDITTNFYSVFRFYPNGYFNYFVIDRDGIEDINMFNPSAKGYRGTFYYENDKIAYDVFVPTTGTGHYMGKLSGEFVIKGDTLINYRNKVDKYPKIYIKREVPKEYLDYQVDWKGDLEKQGK